MSSGGLRIVTSGVTVSDGERAHATALTRKAARDPADAELLLEALGLDDVTPAGETAPQAEEPSQPRSRPHHHRPVFRRRPN